MADAATLANQLVETAVSRQQAVMRCDPDTPVEIIRVLVRESARISGVLIRTGMIEDVLVVIRADADLWQEDADTMRRKLEAPDEPNVVGGGAT